jgi:hypothetical protein
MLLLYIFIGQFVISHFVYKNIAFRHVFNLKHPLQARTHHFLVCLVVNDEPHAQPPISEPLCVMCVPINVVVKLHLWGPGHSLPLNIAISHTSSPKTSEAVTILINQILKVVLFNTYVTTAQ